MGAHQKVSVIIPTYNMASMLPRAIESALAQDHSPLEVIVADDGSTDRTQDVLKRYDGNIHVLQLSHKNRAAAVNAALQQATGAYVTLLDADDTLPSNSVSCRVAHLAERPTLGGVFANSAYYRNGIRYDVRTPSKDFLAAEDKAKAFVYARTVPCTTISLLCRTDAMREIGGFDPRFTRAQDMDFTYRFLAHNSVGYVNETAYNYNTDTHKRTKRVLNRLQCIKADAMLAAKQGSTLEAAKLFCWRGSVDVAKLGFELFTGVKRLSIRTARGTMPRQSDTASTVYAPRMP